MSSRSYQQYCALARALDVVGERWTMLIIRNLLLGGLRFGELRDGLPDISPNLLSDRLKKLAEAEIVTKRQGLYELTTRGRELQDTLFALASWGERHLMGPPAPDEKMRVRYAMTSLKRRIQPTENSARILLVVGDQPYSFLCGPRPDVAQGRWPGVDLEIGCEVADMKALFFAGEPIEMWLARDGVTVQGPPDALDVFLESLGLAS